MLQGFYHTGSYYEGLRVNEPTEFDINIVLDLGSLARSLALSWAGQKPGYVSLRTAGAVNLAPSDPLMPHASRILSTFFRNGICVVDQVSAWVEGIIARILGRIRLPTNVTVPGRAYTFINQV